MRKRMKGNKRFREKRQNKMHSYTSKRNFIEHSPLLPTFLKKTSRKFDTFRKKNGKCKTQRCPDDEMLRDWLALSLDSLPTPEKVIIRFHGRSIRIPEEEQRHMLTAQALRYSATSPSGSQKGWDKKQSVFVLPQSCRCR